jgi:hypothetical protein
MSTRTYLAQSLRKVASVIREEAAKVESQRMYKCAQVLIAARGIAVLQDWLKGPKYGNVN